MYEDEANIFGMSGRIGRGRALMTYIVASLVVWSASLILFLIPVDLHWIEFKTFVPHRIIFYWPSGTAGGLSWILFASYLALLILVYWVMAAAAVKRLHDRGRSGKWVAIYLGVFGFDTLISLLTLEVGEGTKLAIDFLELPLFVGLALFGVWGMCEVFLLPPRDEASDAVDIRTVGGLGR
jgi:uncharacterized membrane protein YhaH (DUF805 family)